MPVSLTGGRLLPMTSIFEFEWPVDQAGYEIRKEAEPYLLPLTRFMLPDPPPEIELVYPRGGPPRYYRPMDDEHAGLWLRFAHTCTSPEQVLAFANSYGLLNTRGDLPAGVLASRFDYLNHTLGLARYLRQIAAALDADERECAARLYNVFDRIEHMKIVIQTNRKSFKTELKFAPMTLVSALMIQAAEAITGNRRFRRCRNDRCTQWFQVGQGAASIRKEFCTDRCRVAWARQHQQGSTANA